MKRALRMVFVRDLGPEQCENAVAGTLYVTIIVASSIDHYFQGWIDNRASLLGVEVLLKFSRALDVSEQRGDGLAFTFDIFVGQCLNDSNLQIVRFLW